jgi:hypothetical protein
MFSFDGENDNRQVAFKLVESEGGVKSYVFDYLVR